MFLTFSRRWVWPSHPRVHQAPEQRGHSCAGECGPDQGHCAEHQPQQRAFREYFSLLINSNLKTSKTKLECFIIIYRIIVLFMTSVTYALPNNDCISFFLQVM